MLSLLGAAVAAPSAQADGLGGGLTQVVRAAGSTAAETAKQATAVPAQATKTPAAVVTNAVSGTPVAQPVKAATTAVSKATDAAGGSAQQLVEKTTAAASSAAAPVTEVADRAAGPSAGGLVQPVADTVRETVATVTQAAAPVTTTASSVPAPPSSSEPSRPPSSPASTPAGQAAVGAARPVQPVRGSEPAGPTSTIPPVSESDSSTVGGQRPSPDASAPFPHVVDAVISPIATGARPAAAPVTRAFEIVTSAAARSGAAPVTRAFESITANARDAARTVVSRLPGQPRLPLGTPTLGGAAAGGTGISLLLLATLLAPFVLAAPRRGRRLRPAYDLVRPPLFVSLLERPG